MKVYVLIAAFAALQVLSAQQLQADSDNGALGWDEDKAWDAVPDNEWNEQPAGSSEKAEVKPANDHDHHHHSHHHFRHHGHHHSDFFREHFWDRCEIDGWEVCNDVGCWERHGCRRGPSRHCRWVDCRSFFHECLFGDQECFRRHCRTKVCF